MQSPALTFVDAELEARFERWFDASTASWELAGSWALVLGALLWVLAQWRLFGAALASNDRCPSHWLVTADEQCPTDLEGP